MTRDLPAGWLTAPEAKQLRVLAAGCWVLELGAWKGRSTVVMAETATHVISVDRHQGIEEAGGEDSLPDYLNAVRPLQNVTIIIGSFETVVEQLASHSISMVYIDGDHDYHSVCRDVELAAVCAKPDLIVFHDWDFAEVRAAGEEYFNRGADGIVGSVAWYRL